jgi:hypothetical protein
MLRRENSLAHKRGAAYILQRSNAASGRAVCFLGRFLPKLGGATCAAIFLRPWQPVAPDGGPERRVGSVPGQDLPATLTRLRLRDEPDNRVTHELRAVGEHCGGADPNDRLLARKGDQ